MPDVKLSRTEYKDAVGAIINKLIALGFWTEEEGQYRLDEAIGRYDIEGWHVELPFVQDYLYQPRYARALISETVEQTQALQKDFDDWMKQVTILRMQQAYRDKELGQQQQQWQSEMGTRMAEVGTQKELARRVAEANWYEQEAQRMSGWSQQNEQAIRESEQRKMAQEFEWWRSNIMSGTAPRDWVVREKAKLAQNPFEVQPQTAEDYQAKMKEGQQEAQQAVKEAESEVANAQKSWNDLAARVVDDYEIIAPGEVVKAQYRYNNAVNRLNAIETTMNSPSNLAALAEEQAAGAPRVDAFGNVTVGTWEPPSTPKKLQIPTDVLPFMQNKEFGSPVVTPSGQQWSASPWSTKERVLGYAESIGQFPEDIYNQMEMMRSNTPRIAYQWSPARQR